MMENLLCVKGRTVGKGKPLVCVPVMASDKENILKEFNRLIGRRVDMVEWRVDAFDGVGSPNAIREVLAELAPLVKDTILVYTFRSKAQGGLRSFDAERMDDIRQVAAESKVVDFIDIEVFESRRPDREIRRLQSMGVYVIASHHDFHQTPDRPVIRMLMQQLYESGADIVKLALMPQKMQDVMSLMEETRIFHEENPDRALITMSMGPLGSITRVAGEYIGSCVSFGAGMQASAPGQLPMEDLEKVLSILHRSLQQ